MDICESLSLATARDEKSAAKKEDHDSGNRAKRRNLIDPPPGEERTDWNFKEDDE